MPGDGVPDRGYCTGVFAKLVSKLDYPMYVVTADAAGERAGCLVGFGTQTSIRPPRFLVCISRKNRTYEVAVRASALGVHFPSDERLERQVAELFGSETGDVTDKFERCKWHAGPAGVPFLDAIPSRFAGRVLERLDLGDHVGFLLEPVEAESGGRADRLSFHDVKDVEPGHEP